MAGAPKESRFGLWFLVCLQRGECAGILKTIVAGTTAICERESFALSRIQPLHCIY
jgi:hypothetical protein